MMNQDSETIRIGCGSAYSRDPTELAVKMAEDGDIKYLCCDRLAERTLAKATTNKKEGVSEGYNPLLKEWFTEVLPTCYDKDITIIGSFGAANPTAAGTVVTDLARELGCTDLKIAVITGDDVLDAIHEQELTNLDTGNPLNVEDLPGEIISANAYIGVEPMIEALEADADVIIGGRFGDMSPYLAAMMHEFGWRNSDVNKKARGTAIAHLLECGTHSTGGNFAYPGYVKVPRLDNLGLPLAEVDEKGVGIISKPEGTGGVVSELSMTAQLVYEVHDPEKYKTPDVTADLSEVEIEQVAKDKVKVTGAKGKPKPEDYKVLVGVDEGYMGEIEAGWAGQDSLEKLNLTVNEVIYPVLDNFADELREERIDRIGVDAIHDGAAPELAYTPNEVRLRIAFKTDKRAAANEILDALEPLVFFTAIGGGGLKRNVDSYVGTYPTLLPREAATLEVEIIDVTAMEAAE